MNDVLSQGRGPRIASVVALAWVSAMLSACGDSGAPATGDRARAGAKRPNVIIIVADDLGYSDLGAFGSEIATPNLDRLAAEGRLLGNFHSTAWCATTRAEILTGVDHHLVGMGTLPDLNSFYSADEVYAGELNDHAPTLAQLLRDAGYHTYQAGKWHLGGGGPQAFGFEHSFSLAYSANSGANFAPGAGNSSSASQPYYEDGLEATVPDDFFSSDFFTQRIQQYVDRDRADGRPFFAYLAFQAVHFPIQVPDAYLDLYKGRYDAGYEVVRNARIARQKALGLIPLDFAPNPGDEAVMTRLGSPGVNTNLPWEALLPTDRQSEARIMEVFAGMVTNMDDNVGRLVAYLKRIGEYDNSFIVFLSDNGADGIGNMANGAVPARDLNNNLDNYGRPGSFIYRSTRWAEVGSAPFRLFKGFGAEGGISVPAILKLPQGRAQPISGAVSSLFDLAPTVLAVSGVPAPGATYAGKAIVPLEGVSLLPLLLGQSSVVHGDDTVFADEVNDIRYVRRGRWKMTRIVNYVVPPPAALLDHDWQLYDLETNRGETTDVRAAHPDIAAELLADWQAYVARTGAKTPNFPVIVTPINQ